MLLVSFGSTMSFIFASEISYRHSLMIIFLPVNVVFLLVLLVGGGIPAEESLVVGLKVLVPDHVVSVILHFGWRGVSLTIMAPRLLMLVGC